MLETCHEAPFITFNDEVTYQRFERDVLEGNMNPLDYIGRTEDDQLAYRNKQMPLLGVIASAEFPNRDRILNRIVASHMKNENAQLLIFRLYCSDDELPITPLPMVNILEAQQFDVIVSPDGSTAVKDMYDRFGCTVRPLGLSSEHLGRREILELFNPRLDDEGSEKIRNKMNHIVSQLSEPVEIHQLSELIENEKFDDNGETFIAPRQMLLSRIVMSEEDGGSTHASKSRQTIVDLSDAALKNTGTDRFLMDQILREFLTNRQDQKKMVVIPRGEHLLKAPSTLSRTLESVVNSGAVDVLISTNDLSALSPSMYDAVDFIFLSQARSTLWRGTLRGHFPDVKVFSSTRRTGAFSVFSPNSIHVRDVNADITYEYWDNACTTVYLEKDDSVVQRPPVQSSIPQPPFHPDDKNNVKIKAKDGVRPAWSRKISPINNAEERTDQGDGNAGQSVKNFKRQDSHNALPVKSSVSLDNTDYHQPEGRLVDTVTVEMARLWFTRKSPSLTERFSTSTINDLNEDNQSKRYAVESKSKQIRSVETQASISLYKHFTPLIITLVAPRKIYSLDTPLIVPVGTYLLKYIPDLLERAGCPSISDYLQNAENRGLVKIFNESGQKLVTLVAEHKEADISNLTRWPNAQ